MSALLLKGLGPGGFHKSPSAGLLAFSEYREMEASNTLQSSVSHDGELLEYATLELRVHPANVEIDNEADDQLTLVTVDSANRPGTLVEVVQHFTELGLNVKSARISSDGGWFVDVFEVCENNGQKVTDPVKLKSIKEMLTIKFDEEEEVVQNGDETDDPHRVETTVFELSGVDRPGLLGDVTQLLTTNGCNVRSAAVWTYKERVAFVLSVTEKGQPVQDNIKLQRLRQLLCQMMDAHGNNIVNIKKVRGEVHHDRRLHRLMLEEEVALWEAARAAQLGCPPPPRHSLSLSDSRLSLVAFERAAAARGSPGAASQPLLVTSASCNELGGLSRLARSASSSRHGIGGSAHGASLFGSSRQFAGGALVGTPRTPSAAIPVMGSSAAALAQGIAELDSGSSQGSADSSSTSLPAEALAAPDQPLVSARPPLGGSPLAQGGARSPAGGQDFRSPKHSRPEIEVSRCGQGGYWLVKIACKDRAKLLFDTVCTLADLSYDVFHATIDGNGGLAQQEYYIKPRLGPPAWDPLRAAKLAAMLESSIQRRFPRGLKVHVVSVDRFGCLAALTRVLGAAGLAITRAKVKTYAVNSSSGHTFYVMDASGGPPDRQKVEAACAQIGGRLVAEGQERAVAVSSGDQLRFSFSFLARQCHKGWPGADLAAADTAAGSPCSSHGST